MQELAPVVGYEGRYSVTSTGDVYSHPYTRSDGRRRKGIWLRPATTRYGYKQVVLTKPDKSRHSLSVHRLVAQAFLGDYEDLQVNHKNGIKDDNRVENLEWCTQEENLKHAHRTGLIDQRGLTAEEVVEIRTMLEEGYFQPAIAKIYGVDQPTISKIKNKVIYKDVA